MSSHIYFNRTALCSSILTTLACAGSFFEPYFYIVSLVFSIISTFMHAYKAFYQYKYLNSINGALCKYLIAATTCSTASIFSFASLLMYPNMKIVWIAACVVINIVANCWCGILYKKETMQQTTVRELPVVMSQLLESQRSESSTLQEKIQLAQEQLEQSQNTLRELEIKMEEFSLAEDDSNIDELLELLLNIEETKTKIELLYNKINQLREALQRLTLEPLLPPPYSEHLRPNETQANSYDLDRNGRPIEVCIDMESNSISLLKQKLKTLLRNLKSINDTLTSNRATPLTQEEQNSLISERDTIIKQIVQIYKDITNSETTVQLPSYSSRCGSKELVVESA